MQTILLALIFTILAPVLVNSAFLRQFVSAPNQFTQYRVLMIVGDMTEDYEAMVPYQALKMLGFQVDTVSPGKLSGDSVQTVVDDAEPGWQTFSEKLGHRFPINFDIRNVKLDQYRALIVPGGRAPEHLQLNRDVIELVREAMRLRMPVASICHGPLILAAAGVLKNRICSAYEGIRPQVEAAGCQFKKVEDDGVVVDDLLITAPTWAAHPQWLAALLKQLPMPPIYDF